MGMAVNASCILFLPSSSSSSTLRRLLPLQKQQQQQLREGLRRRRLLNHYHYFPNKPINNNNNNNNIYLDLGIDDDVNAASSISMSTTIALATYSSSSSSSSYSTVSSIGCSEEVILLEVSEIRERCNTWQWKGYTINYFTSKCNNNNSNNSTSSDSDSDSDSPPPPPLLLVHGFGASIPHWRRNIMTLTQSYTVYAIDLLGFGASDKPAGFEYTMEAWAQLILDFLYEIVQRPTVLVGNSVGSLACVIAAAESSRSLVRGLVLLNCAGGMNNKAIVDDWRIKLLLPLFWLIDFLLKQRGIASIIFERVKQRDNLRNILLSIYGDKESVDEDLVEIIREPANNEGALDAFVAIVTGPPGPNPVQLMQRIALPVLILWGDRDPFTPLDGPVGKYFSSLPSQQPNVSLFVLEGVGHCPHDDRPDLVHEKLLPWLASLPAS